MLKKIASVVLMAGLTGALLLCSAQSGKDKFIKIYLPGGPSITAQEENAQEKHIPDPSNRLHNGPLATHNPAK